MFIIAVFDTSAAPDDDDKALLEKVRSLGKRTLIVLNKSDLESAADEGFFKEYCENIVYISAKDPDDRSKIQAAAEKIFTPENYDADSTIFANERQRGCLAKAHRDLTAALEALDMGETLDAVTVLVDYAADSLLELSCEKATEAVVSEVFSKFCVGK
jgi:tRNA modification GTPase